MDAIDQIVQQTGVKESDILRKLIDEALSARSRQAAAQDLGSEDDAQSSNQTLRPVQALLVKLVEHAEKSMRVQDVGLVLLQETLAEARAGRKASWQNVTSRLKERGLSTKDLSKRFDDETSEARQFAYGAAKEIKRQQKR